MNGAKEAGCDDYAHFHNTEEVSGNVDAPSPRLRGEGKGEGQR
ncbi:hypothetical protein GCM10010837_37160 [Aminobacter niigataensis]